MLTVAMDWRWIDSVHYALLGQATAHHARMADRVIAMYVGFEALAKAFDRFQQRAWPDPPFPDGRIDTIRRAVLAPGAAFPFPRAGSRIFQGLVSSSVHHFAAYGMPHSYAVRLDMGPAHARRYGDLTAIGVYCEEPCIFTIVWIGPEESFAAAFADIVSRAPCPAIPP